MPFLSLCGGFCCDEVRSLRRGFDDCGEGASVKVKKPTEPKKEKPKEIPFGLSLDLDDCYDEFAERAKVLPFVLRPKGE